jgi:hypothetical protein
VFLWINAEYWYPQDYFLADWLTIELLYPLILGVGRVQEYASLSITDIDNTCMFNVFRRILAVFTLIFKVFGFFWSMFLYGWTFYGLILITSDLHKVGFWFHLTVFTLVILQIIGIAVTFLALMVVGYYWTMFKEEIRYKFLK